MYNSENFDFDKQKAILEGKQVEKKKVVILENPLKTIKKISQL